MLLDLSVVARHDLRVGEFPKRVDAAVTRWGPVDGAVLTRLVVAPHHGYSASWFPESP